MDVVRASDKRLKAIECGHRAIGCLDDGAHVFESLSRLSADVGAGHPPRSDAHLPGHGHQLAAGGDHTVRVHSERRGKPPGRDRPGHGPSYASRTYSKSTG